MPLKHASDLGGLGILASANLGAASVSSFLSGVEPFLHTMISLAQLAIAVVTVWYIVRRTRQLSGAAKIVDKERQEERKERQEERKERQEERKERQQEKDDLKERGSGI